MIVTRKALARRTFLRGMGAAIGLPLLDSMIPAFAGTTASKTPVRIGWMYVPNGIDMRFWTPAQEGPLTDLPRILKPLEPVKNDVLVISNLAQNYGRALFDGPGDHGRAAANYLTGVHVYKTAGADIKLGISADQVAAKELGRETRLPSLELGLEDGRQAGNCDSGYSCAYTNNIAWLSETQPLPPLIDPRGVFERLFGSGIVESPAAHARRMSMRRSILDLVTADTKKLETGLGPSDRRKLDEYLSSIREIERQIAKAESDNAEIDPKMDKPYGAPADYGEHFDLMAHMMTIAMQADLTRIFTWMMAREGSSRPYREIGVSDGHHPLTHHKGDMTMLGKVTEINCYHLQLFARFVDKLKSTKEGDGTLLDNSMIVYGAGLSDGNAHTHDGLPVVIAGGGGKFLKTGRHVIYQRETPLTNLYISMLDRLGVRPGSIGDSTGPLEGLSGLA
jgi:hypothetical protein